MKRWLSMIPAAAFCALPALAHDHPELSDEYLGLLERPDPSELLAHHDEAVKGIVSSGPSAKVTKNLAVAGHAERLVPNATTDVWAHEKHAYIGTFNTPCGGTDDEEAGVQIYYVGNPNNPYRVGAILSPDGSRSNDVKVAEMNSGDILVHSNESCAGGPGGFEIYNVDNPESPEFLASVRIDELNMTANDLFGGLTDVGVHNLWLFTQGNKDYVGVVSEGAFDNFRIYDITDPANPAPAGAWGAEEVFDPGVGESNDVGRVLDAALWLLDGFGDSANRFLHDVTVNEAGDRVWLSNWDAGLVLLDISDPASPSVISVALDPANGSLDGEVNSHAAWPSEDGTIVVETEEDFNAWEIAIPPSNLTAGDAPIPATAISTRAGDDFTANPIGNEVTVTGSQIVVTSGPLAGETYAAAELSDQPGFGGGIVGEAVFIGRACSGDPIENGAALGDAGVGIAVVRRGDCTFNEKILNAEAAGAEAVVIANQARDTTPWSGARIWDYSDPANPVLLTLFDTVCSASAEPIPGCNQAGTYSVHNVVVEGDKAYFSWYTDGVLVVDISDPANPVETARFTGAGAEFEASNGGIQDVWGIYKIPNEPWIYASDRNGGLYVFKEYGSGSAKQGKAPATN